MSLPAKIHEALLERLRLEVCTIGVFSDNYLLPLDIGSPNKQAQNGLASANNFLCFSTAFRRAEAAFALLRNKRKTDSLRRITSFVSQLHFAAPKRPLR